MSASAAARVRSPRAVPAPAAPGRACALAGRGRGAEPARPPAPHAPSPARCQAPVSLPLTRAELPRDTVRPLSVSAHSAPRSHQLVCVPSHPGAPAAAPLHTKETGARAAGPPRAPERPQPGPGASGGAGARGDHPPPSPRRPPGLPPQVSLAPTQPARGGRAGRPGPTAPSEGGEGRSLLTPHEPQRHPGKARSGVGGITRTG